MRPPSALLYPDGWWRRLLWVALAAAVAAHLYGLYRGEPGGVDLFQNADKVWHFLGFAIPSTLAVLLIRRWWPVAVFAANAVVSELVQHFFLPNRAGDPTDLLADLSGLLPAIALLCWLQAASASMSSSRPTSRTSAASRRPKA